MTSGGSSPQGVPKACKKAGFAPTGAVCRSCTTMPVSTGAPPPGGKGGTPFPALVPGAGTLPVGFQGRSALVAEGEIPGAVRRGGRVFGRRAGKVRRGSLA